MFTRLRSSSTTSCSWRRMAFTNVADIIHRADQMTRLVKEAAIKSKQSGERGLSARSVKKVTRDTLTKFKG
ncbi:unnamed protein product [Fusarium equiseti]|uniref:Uncharacterized protein n=1 Tax=Fusarium equiseti TaxID=61235 RepID=A0A8J2IDW1_FUSEQ|nr:unnamed protein product [Fusarium equiseti]